MEEPGRLQSMGSQRVGLSLSTVTRKKPQEHAREEALLWRKQEGPKVETKLNCHPKGTGGSPTGQRIVCEEAEAGWE